MKTSPSVANKGWVESARRLLLPGRRNLRWARGLLLCGALFGGGLLAGCGEECAAGKACIFSGGTVNRACGGNGAGCAFECKDGADCTLACPGGSCSLKCTGAKSCNLDCPGNSCSVSCTGTQSGGACKISSCTTQCPLNCGGASNCNNSCSLSTGCPTVP